jgi:predicted alpha/beta hydrolase family esterase
MRAVDHPDGRRQRMATRQVLFVHGAGGEAFEEDAALVRSLREALGPDFGVAYPEMPDADDPEFGKWRARISHELSTLDGGVILVGHSLGASILLKYLSEERVEKPIAGVFLIATPYWGTADWEAEFKLREDFPAVLPEDVPIFFYHSRDDEVVPFAHLALYASELPRATVRKVDGRGHQFGDDLAEVAEDIARL